MMKKIILSILLGLIAFTSGIVGTIMLVPSLAPERSQRARAMADSLIRMDSLAHAQEHQVNRMELLEQILKGQTPVPPSAEERILAILGLTPDSLRMIIQKAREVEHLRDSLARLNQALQQASLQQQKIQEEIEHLKEQWALAEDEIARAAEISRVLPKLDDQQLAEIVRDLDPKIFQRIYIRATNRNRKRLLQALPPDKAATFVENLVALGELVQPPSEKQ